MTISARALNRATLARQLLLERQPLAVNEAVRRLVALQAQEAPSPYLALWNRLVDFDPTHLDAAFASSEIVKAPLMRITLHAVHADDYPIFREAMDPTFFRAYFSDGLFTETGTTAEAAIALAPAFLAHAEIPRTADEISAWLSEHPEVSQHPGLWSALRQYAPLQRAPTGGLWSFQSRIAFLTPPIAPQLGNADIAETSLRMLILRYLEGFGPATIADFSKFALVPRTRARQALAALGNQLERLVGPNGEELFDIPGAPRPDEDTPAPARLLGMWDNTLLAYDVRDRIIPPEYRKITIRINGDVLPTLLVDGYVAGLWRVTEAGIEATAFHDLPDDTWAQLATEARSLTNFLTNRDPAVYRRFNHWWDKHLPSADVRLLSTW